VTDELAFVALTILSYPVAAMMGIEPMPCGTPVMAVSVASRTSGMRGIHRQSLNTSHRRGGLLPQPRSCELGVSQQMRWHLH
jgi:hypothetical protein